MGQQIDGVPGIMATDRVAYVEAGERGQGLHAVRGMVVQSCRSSITCSQICPAKKGSEGYFSASQQLVLLMVGVDIGKFVKLQVEEAGISAPPTFLDFCNLLRAYVFLKE